MGTPVKHLQQLRSSLQKAPSEEGVHTFRVMYKKVRAFYRMAGVVQKGRPFAMPANWNKCYQVGGHVRETQLLIHLVETEIGEGPLLRLLEAQLAAHLIAFQSVGRIQRPSKLVSKKWKKHGKKAYARYFGEKLRDFFSNYRQPLYDEELHAFRKSLKDLLYQHNWLAKMRVPLPIRLGQLPLEQMNSLQQLLGDYQDKVSQLAIIRQLTVLPALAAIAPQLENWISRSFHQQVVLRNRVEEALQDFFHLHASGPFYE